MWCANYLWLLYLHSFTIPVYGALRRNSYHNVPKETQVVFRPFPKFQLNFPVIMFYLLVVCILSICSGILTLICQIKIAEIACSNLFKDTAILSQTRFQFLIHRYTLSNQIPVVQDGCTFPSESNLRFYVYAHQGPLC